MNIYLYGKKRFLGDLIEGDQGIRLSDIAYYSIMENEEMRDNELQKEFVLDKEGFVLEVNGHKINSNDMTQNPTFTVAPPRCFCVCFSVKKNSPELFERFKADVCIEVSLEALLDVLRASAERFEGMDVIHGPVCYYPPIMSDAFPDIDSVLFSKRDIYSVEAEYRVAVTVPPHRKNFRSVDGETIRIFSDDPKDIRHLFVNGVTPEINKNYVLSVFYL